MSQPLGFINSQFHDHVCKLHKALYGLKQATCAWYHALKAFLLDYRLINSRFDTSLFIYRQNNVLAYFLIYVDDLLVTGNNASFLATFKQALAQQFSLKDLGTAYHFLCIEIIPTSEVSSYLHIITAVTFSIPPTCKMLSSSQHCYQLHVI